MTRPTILIVEEDPALRRRLRRVLASEGIEVIDASDGSEAVRSISVSALDLAIVGSSAAGTAPSLEVAQQIRRSCAGIPIILITSRSSEQLAIAALRSGIRDYFTHPVPFAELTASVKRCLTARAPDARSPVDGIAQARARMIGDGPRMREIHAYIEQVAAMESTVLITGETGTGKELAAALIHQGSRRRQQPFVHINCAAIPDTLLESELFGYERGAFTGANAASAGKLKLADGGTVLFDEIGDMSIYAQAKILRLLESREIERLGGRQSLPVDVRVVAATNQDLERLMIDGRFRKDLYFRLNVARIHLPALRERKEDLPALVDHYIREFSHVLGRHVDGITDEALAALLRHDWPGNVRELRNVVESTFATQSSPRISLSDLPPAYRGGLGGPAAAVPEGDRERLLAALSATKWNKSQAAARLRWSRMTIYRKMAKYHLVDAGHVAGAHGDEPI